MLVAAALVAGSLVFVGLRLLEPGWFGFDAIAHRAWWVYVVAVSIGLFAGTLAGLFGIGGGIAIPHPRNPALLHVTRPPVTLAFLENPVAFLALDGAPVKTVFTLVTPTLRSHLHLLSLLGFVLQKTSFRRLLGEAASREALFTELRRIEQRLSRRAP